jgi:AcrR family transcriptional regulator
MNSSKEKITQAAIGLFAARGFRGTSIRGIARAIGTSASNIYHYFGNKEGLMLAILQHTNAPLISQLEAISKKDMDPLARFKLLIETHIHLTVQYMQPSKITNINEEHLSREGERVSKQLQRTILNFYTKELRILHGLGFVRSKNLTILALNILAAINWMVRWYRRDGKLSIDEISKETVSFALYGALGFPQADKREPKKRRRNR